MDTLNHVNSTNHGGPEAVEFQRDAWLSDVLRRECFRVTIGEHVIKKGPPKSYEKLRDLCAEEAVFLYSKIPVHQMQACTFLEDLGFRIVDTNIRLETAGALSIIPGKVFETHFATEAARDQVVNIARHSFQYSRFHLDRTIPTVLADEIKAKWVGNYFLGKRGDYLVVASHRGKVCGFLQLLKEAGGLLVIDLIAVAKEHRGIGAASDMIAFAARECRGTSRLGVGTQAANLASIRLYEKLGFRMVSSAHVFHFHGAGSG